MLVTVGVCHSGRSPAVMKRSLKMYLRKVVLPLTLVTVMFFMGCSKAPVVVTVDVDRVAGESKDAQMIISEVESFSKSAEEQINRAAGQIQTLSNDPRSNPEQLNMMKMQFSEMVKQAEQEVMKRRDMAEEEVHMKLEKALDSLARENGWDIVIRKGPQSALWAGEALDRTKMVIERMDGVSKKDTKTGS